MKDIFIAAIIMATVFEFSTQAQADLTLLGQGTSVYGTYNLIYDADLDITWYDYTRPVNSWRNQVDLAEALSVTFGSNNYTDWRLPTALNRDGTGPCFGYGCTGSELGHLFYTELGNKGYCEASGKCPQTGWGLTYTGDFKNLKPGFYWSATEYAHGSSLVWGFNIRSGYQENDLRGYSNYAIAVRPGLALAPEPTSMVLFGTGGIVLVARRKLSRRRLIL